LSKYQRASGRIHLINQGRCWMKGARVGYDISVVVVKG